MIMQTARVTFIVIVLATASGDVTTEHLRLFKTLWTQDDPKFDGKHAQVSGVGFQPKPLQKPHPPLWIGGHSGAALRRVAELGAAGLRPPPLLEPPDIAAIAPGRDSDGAAFGCARVHLGSCRLSDDLAARCFLAASIIERLPQSRNCGDAVGLSLIARLDTPP